MKINFNVQDIKNILGYENIAIEKDFIIYGPSNINEPKNNTIMFVKNATDDIICNLKDITNSIIIASEGSNSSFKNLENRNLILYVKKPRREYAIILSYIVNQNKANTEYHDHGNNIIIGKNVLIGKHTLIEPCVFIDNDVKIGNNCTIMSGARIRSGVIIGNDTVIMENSVIGDQGYGIERDEDGSTIRIPHLGGVIIGNNVEIGALTAVVAGTIDPTIIEDYVKVDNLVHIAHNCKIGRGSMIIACAEISGSTEIGESSWVAPNACIINKTHIGRNVTIGMGAVVLKDIPDGQIVTGNPAQPIEEIKKLNKIRKELLKNTTY